MVCLSVVCLRCIAACVISVWQMFSTGTHCQAILKDDSGKGHWVNVEVIQQLQIPTTRSSSSSPSQAGQYRVLRCQPTRRKEQPCRYMFAAYKECTFGLKCKFSHG